MICMSASGGSLRVQAVGYLKHQGSPLGKTNETVSLPLMGLRASRVGKGKPMRSVRFQRVVLILGVVLLGVFASSGVRSQDATKSSPVQKPLSTTSKKNPAAEPPLDFPLGTATPSEACADCHQAIYNEHAFGFGADLKFKPMINQSLNEPLLVLPPGFSDTGTAHHLAGVDPWPIRAREVENGGAVCNVCHFPEPLQLPAVNSPSIPKPVPRPILQSLGITCASCHLTPDGKIRGPYDVVAPHPTVMDPATRTSAMCAYCHSEGERIVGKQTQTFLEWRFDFYNAGLGQQQCQDCHMPQTVRSLAEGFDVPARVSGRHLWTGDHSPGRLAAGLGLSILQTKTFPPPLDRAQLEFHVVNTGAGHSVPTGSNRRAIYLDVELINSSNAVVASKEWMFAPWYGNRPDDRGFLEADKALPDAIAASQADAQGPHETIIRAGEDRALSWEVNVAPGNYTVRAVLIYDINRYNDRAFTDDQTEIARTALSIQVPFRTTAQGR